MTKHMLDDRTEKKMESLSLDAVQHVQMWDSHGGDNQRWYVDGDEKIIRSVTTGFCLTSNGMIIMKKFVGF